MYSNEGLPGAPNRIEAPVDQSGHHQKQHGNHRPFREQRQGQQHIGLFAVMKLDQRDETRRSKSPPSPDALRPGWRRPRPNPARGWQRRHGWSRAGRIQRNQRQQGPPGLAWPRKTNGQHRQRRHTHRKTARPNKVAVTGLHQGWGDQATPRHLPGGQGQPIQPPWPPRCRQPRSSASAYPWAAGSPAAWHEISTPNASSPKIANIAADVIKGLRAAA